MTRITVKAVRSSSHSPTIARSETDREDGSGELARIRLPLDGHDSRPRMEAADDVPFVFQFDCRHAPVQFGTVDQDFALS